MRYFTKTALASIAVAAAVFATTYAVEDLRLREISRKYREALQPGALWTYCGPRPIHYAVVYGLSALICVPIVLLSARGAWRLCARLNSDQPNTA
jgi:hypothetical protein